MSDYPLRVDAAARRDAQAVRNGAPATVTHAEAFRRTFPTVGDRLW
jgi:4-oxalomesaconate hydratase